MAHLITIGMPPLKVVSGVDPYGHIANLDRLKLQEISGDIIREYLDNESD